jgi:glycosyltransferase involved in cell wall biosynthesis
MSLRIAHVTATFPPYLGGTGNVCFHNARELVRRGHEVHVITPASAKCADEEMLQGITVKRLGSLLSSGNAHVVPGLLRHLRGFDVVHLHYPFIGGEVAALAAKWAGVPLVITYHQDVLLRGPMKLVEATIRHTLGRAALRSADRVLFTTLDYARSSYVYPMLHPVEHAIDELPNGVDSSAFCPPDSVENCRKRLKLPVDQAVILLVARLDRAHYFKGVDVFLEAFGRLPDDVRAVVVGDGDLRARYQEIAERNGIADRVTFAGRVADDDLPAFYQAADITVLPSTTMGEAFGLVLVESMACGTPVIASNLPGVRSVVSHEVDGLLVDPGDAGELASAINRLLSDHCLRAEMGREGRFKVERRYDWSSIGDRLESVYCQVIDAPQDLIVSAAPAEE